MTIAMPIGHYHPAGSVVHRLPAGVKLVAMLAAVVAIMVWNDWWQLAVAAAATALLFVVARIPVRLAWAQLRPLRYILLAVAALQWWLADWHTAVAVCGTILISVALAAVVTLTTRVTDMLDAIGIALTPLKLVGVNPDRIGLLLAVTIRCIPLVASIVSAVMEARKARGLGFSITALAAPVVIRSLRSADALGDALIARGADD